MQNISGFGNVALADHGEKIHENAKIHVSRLLHIILLCFGSGC